MLGLTTIITNGLLALINLSEWDHVKVKGNVSDYPFGGEGPTPFYYETAELYTSVCLFWGIVFLLLFCISALLSIKKLSTLTWLAFGLTVFSLLLYLIQSQI